MVTYTIRRLFQAIVVLIVLSIVVFLMMRLMPSDPILMYVGQDVFAIDTSPERIAALEHEYGLDQPLPVQYIRWIGGVVRGDLGYSISLQTPVIDAIGRALPKSVYLGILGLIVSVLLGVPAGVLSAVNRGKLLDTGTTSFANLGVTVPVYWLGIMMIYVFGLFLHVLPTQGYVSPTEDIVQSLRHAILPVICLSIIPVAALTRQTRSAMLEVTRQDYIRTARAKGLTERLVIMKHGLRNALIPVVTLTGMMIRYIVGGQVYTEKIFGITGMGNLAVDAVISVDYALVQGVILVIAAIIVIVNLFIDISYGWLDPRIRYN